MKSVIFNITDVNYDLIKTTKNKEIYYDNGQPLLIELPFLLLKDKNEKEIILSNKPKNEKNKTSIDFFFEQLNNAIIKIIKTNRNEWVVDKSFTYHSIISKNIIKMNIMNTYIFNLDKQNIDLSKFLEMNEEMYIKSLIQVSKIIFNEKDIITELIVHQILIQPIIDFKFDFSTCCLNIEDLNIEDPIMETSYDNQLNIEKDEEKNNDSDEENNEENENEGNEEPNEETTETSEISENN